MIGKIGEIRARSDCHKIIVSLRLVADSRTNTRAHARQLFFIGVQNLYYLAW